jgi:hypothetical protein
MMQPMCRVYVDLGQNAMGFEAGFSHYFIPWGFMAQGEHGCDYGYFIGVCMGWQCGS